MDGPIGTREIGKLESPGKGQKERQGIEASLPCEEKLSVGQFSLEKSQGESRLLHRVLTKCHLAKTSVVSDECNALPLKLPRSL